MDSSEKSLTELKNELVILRRNVANLERNKTKRFVQNNKITNVDDHLLRSIIDGLPDGIYAKDTQARKTYSNRVDVRQSGCTSEKEVLGKTDFNFYPHELARKFYSDDMRVLQTGKPIVNRQEKYVDEKGKTNWLLTSKYPVKNQLNQVIGLVGTGLNFTDHKLDQIALAKTREELKQFTYVASHDLQEPLRVVISYMELLAKHYSSQLDEKAVKYISRAVDATSRMKSFINDLLLMSNVESKKREFEIVPTNDLFKLVLHSLKILILEKNAKIVFDGFPNVYGDPLQIGQLLLNIINNAIKFSMEGVPPIIEVKAKKVGAMVEFSVKDNGIGIDEKHLQRIFVIFQRLHSRTEYSGTGIGLALCKKIVDLHKGQIWIESIPQKGSTFFFTLPGSEDCKGQL